MSVSPPPPPKQHEGFGMEVGSKFHFLFMTQFENNNMPHIGVLKHAEHWLLVVNCFQFCLVKVDVFLILSLSHKNIPKNDSNSRNKSIAKGTIYCTIYTPTKQEIEFCITSEKGTKLFHKTRHLTQMTNSHDITGTL